MRPLPRSPSIIRLRKASSSSSTSSRTFPSRLRREFAVSFDFVDGFNMSSSSRARKARSTASLHHPPRIHVDTSLGMLRISSIEAMLLRTRLRRALDDKIGVIEEVKSVHDDESCQRGPS